MTAEEALQAIEREAYWALQLATGPWGRGELTGEPSRLAVQVRHEHFAKHAQAILDALPAIASALDANQEQP